MFCEGRRCKPSDEINLIYLMYLVLKAINRCLFWRHGFREQALLSRWEWAKLKLDRPTDQGDFASYMGSPTTNQCDVARRLMKLECSAKGSVASHLMKSI